MYIREDYPGPVHHTLGTPADSGLFQAASVRRAPPVSLPASVLEPTGTLAGSPPFVALLLLLGHLWDTWDTSGRLLEAWNRAWEAREAGNRAWNRAWEAGVGLKVSKSGVKVEKSGKKRSKVTKTPKESPRRAQKRAQVGFLPRNRVTFAQNRAILALLSLLRPSGSVTGKPDGHKSDDSGRILSYC